jgi:rhomboid protease GluP
MKIYQNRGGRRIFAIPHAVAVYPLIAANAAAYALCVAYSGMIVIPAGLLLSSGAMYSLAIERHEYWRLGTYGFLHADIVHLTMNMICLALWAGHLEKRAGSFYFLVIYVCALIFGALVSNATHSGPYLMVGASGAISGILGALLCLWILAKVDLSANFFVVNVGLNVALALSASNIDWGAHFGGFAAGMISCALLDVVEKANAMVLRCKFPEFVKMNGFIAACGFALVLLEGTPTVLDSRVPGWLQILAYSLACLAAIKLIDFVLSVKKGVAVVVIAFSAANAALAFFAGNALAVECAPGHFQTMIQIRQLLDLACTNPDLVLEVLAACSFAASIVVYWPWLHRGIADVGFVGASLHAERKRRGGI